VPKALKIGLALGGGAARGFAHIGVIKVLEANGITASFTKHCHNRVTPATKPILHSMATKVAKLLAVLAS
jgi:hypothetical protein